MNGKALTVLEYEKIVRELKEAALCQGAKDMAEKLKPLSVIQEIREELRSTTEAVDLIVSKGPLPIGGLYDIDRSLHFANKGGSLTMGQLLQIHASLRIADGVKTFMKSEDLPELPYIRGMVDVLVSLPGLEKEIDRCIISEDEMADAASPALKDIRRNIGKQNEALKAKLNKIIASSENRTFLQDSIVTMRGGRYVIPVKQEHRTKFPGMIHDQSKGGQTLFIEPQAIVDLNNELRELELAEQAEIARILAELSSRVAEHFDEIRANQKLLVRLDYIMAKGKLSKSMRGEEPKINEEGILDLRQARHPLLNRDTAVPVDIALGERYDSLIVTGPNTGGKTVSLKTAGLLSLMALSGLHIPASSESRVPIYEEIYADIGDEQSIEQSLSTFSSHMKNIVEIIGKADENSLVLLDELGAGTDPTEGAALAIAILEKLSASGAKIMAPTHYNEIKKYALSRPGVENAAMEFDVETLSPTYHLLIGIPGKSNAFEISKKLGIDESVIERANALIERGDAEFEDVISSLEEDRKQAEKDRQEAAEANYLIQTKLAEIEKRERGMDEKRQSIIEKARAEARDILKEARETTKEVQKELRELAKEGMNPDQMRRLEESRARLREVENKNQASTIKQVNSQPVSAADLKVGDRVKVLTIDQNGTVVSLPDDKGSLQVAIGQMKLNVKLNELMLINEGKDRKTPQKSTVSMRIQKAKTISPSVNVQGQNLEDALMDVEKYLDDVYMSGLEKVTIIHGRGEGILRNGIRAMLKKNKLVKSFASGSYDEGGDGVTVVTMKK